MSCRCRTKAVKGNPDDFCYGCGKQVCVECALKSHAGWMQPHIGGTTVKKKRVKR